MKIKIGKFNFINKEENKIYLSSYSLNSNLFDYFYLDGREDTLYVNSRYMFDRAEELKNQKFTSYDFERDLLKKFMVIDYNMKITNEINSFIKEKVNNMFNNQEYSRYNLYNNITLNEILLLEQNSKYANNENYSSTFIDFNNSTIQRGNIILDLYKEKIENLEELYNEGRFNKQIKAGLIKMEIENNIAPKFVTSFIKMNDFFTDKKSVNMLLKDCEKFKINPHISSFFDFKGNKVALNLSYNEEKWFEKENPGRDPKDLKLDDIKGLSYSKEVLELNPEDFKDIEKQIAITLEDKLLFKIDNLKNELEDEYTEIKIANRWNIPYSIREALNEITKIDLRNSQREAGNLEGEIEKYPDYYSEKLEDIFRRYDLINQLNQAETLEDIKEITRELGDNELQKIYYELLDDEENAEEEDEL